MNRLVTMILCILPFGSAVADGYPFDVRTHEIIGTNLRVPLTEVQQTEVASSGRISFTEEQLGWLRLIYPKVPTRLRVIASTFNDGLDERAPNPVDCIWTTPTEVGITLPKKWEKGDYTFDAGGNGSVSDVRISPKGLLYHDGKEISMERAFEIVRTAKKPNGAPIAESPIVRITRSPPFRSSDDEDIASNKKAADIFTALEKYGESLKIAVYPIW